MHKNTPNSTEIPYGYCQCGCGNVTPIARQTDNSRGYVKGQHVRFCVGHRRTMQQESRRFGERVDVRTPVECWEWQAYINDSGYGIVRDGSRSYRAHRVAYRLTHGPIPKGAFVCHKCDNPACCNPAHLFAGTPVDNVRDMYAKGRENLSNTPKGKHHGMAQLTPQDVHEIRRLAEDGVPYTEIAERFGISDVHAGRVAKHENWKHLR